MQNSEESVILGVKDIFVVIELRRTVRVQEDITTQKDYLTLTWLQELVKRNCWVELNLLRSCNDRLRS